MKILSLDLSTKTGWALFEKNKYIKSGILDKTIIDDFNLNQEPNKSPKYPLNLMNAAEETSHKVLTLIQDCRPELIIIEQTVRGKNRHSQRWLEWLHFCVIKQLVQKDLKFLYTDPSEWRKTVGLKLNQEQKKNNQLVSQGKKRGKITKKHLSTNLSNELFGLKLKLKDNDIADAILIGYSYVISHP